LIWRRFIFSILQLKKPLYSFSIAIIFCLLISSFIFFISSPQAEIPSSLVPLFIAAGIAFLFYKLRNDLFLRRHGEFDRIEERINLINEKIEDKKATLQTLPHQRRRVSFLFNVSQNLIELNNPEQIFDFLINAFSDLFPKADTSLLFEFDRETDTLSLSRSLKTHDFIIRAKNGDLLDNWVLRHNRSLLIDDIAKDFRFESHALDAYGQRGAASFMVSPLSISHKILGVARVESKQKNCFNLDDSRLLRNICDLAAIVLERANLFKRAQDLAIKDPLTSFYLKEYFYKRLKAEIRLAKNKKAKIGIIMIDIDDFKSINDEHGHIVGDAVLKRLSRSIVGVAGGTGNLVSRFGGEEFIIALIDLSNDEIKQTVEKLRLTIESTALKFRRKMINFTISLGVVAYPADGLEVMELIDRADKLLYEAKNKGKNQVCCSPNL